MSNQLVFKDKYLFHLTHIGNLPGILKKGILCKNQTAEERIKYVDVSYDDIQGARAQIFIPGTEHTLHDCVPLFFGARPPMLLAIRHKGISQEDMVYLVVNWGIINEPTAWFTDGNARTSGTQFYQGSSNLSRVDFDSADAYYWGADEETKRKKQAEVLKLSNILLDDILGIIVYNKEVEKKVQDMLKAYNIKRSIVVVPRFYY